MIKKVIRYSKYDLVQPIYKSRVLPGLTHGDYICDCPLCGDGVMVEDDDYDGMKIRCQHCGAEADGEYEMTRREAGRVFMRVCRDVMSNELIGKTKRTGAI